MNAVPAGSTIDVCPGTYPEQVTINGKSLTIIGVLSGTNDAAVLVPPSGGLVVNASDFRASWLPRRFSLRMQTGVFISHLSVDGTGNADWLQGQI